MPYDVSPAAKATPERAVEFEPKFGARLETTKPMTVEMDTHGRTGWRHVLVGSVAERVARRARCPVLVVPAHE